MATINALNRYSSAPPAPAVVPVTALLLIEIDGRVYKISIEALVEALG